MKLLYGNLRNLTRIQLVALVIWCLAFLGGSFWVAYRNAQRSELENLYFAAGSGDLASLKRLSEHRSSNATVWLAKVAQNQNVKTDVRMEAIYALGNRRTLDSEIVAPLLWIEQPFDIRHAAVNVFERRGCDDVCASATLYALHGIWTGQETLEGKLATEYPKGGALVEQTVVQVRNQSEQDYLKLLKSNPCVARETLTTHYSSEPSFMQRVQEHLGSCSPAKPSKWRANE